MSSPHKTPHSRRGLIMAPLRPLSALLLTFGLLAVAFGDDQDDKKSKIPPLTVIGNVDGAIASASGETDKITISTREVVRQWVPATGPQRLINGGGQYVMKEQIVQKSFNLSPDVKIRLMNKRPDPPKSDKKKPDPKASNKKDSKKDAGDDAADKD